MDKGKAPRRKAGSFGRGPGQDHSAPRQRPRRPLTGDHGPEILYGTHTAEAALANPGRRIRRILVTRNAAERLSEVLSRHAVPAPEIVSPHDLDSVAGRDAVHQGIVVLADPLPQPRLDQVPRTGVMVLLDQVTDPHNVGAILRSCAAFAVTALVATARHSPEGSAVLYKSASGAVEHVPFVKVTNLSRAMEELKDYGYAIIGLDSAAPATMAEAARAVRAPVALVLGAEGKGLRTLTRETCDVLARLDLPGDIKSLNVSNAAAVALYALTQRQA